MKTKKKTEAEINTPVSSKLSETQFAIIATTLFAIVTLIGLCYHEMWRDEFQAWQVARFSPDLKTFYENQRIESGHLILWNIILYIISHINDGVGWQQIFHVLIAGSSIYVLNRYSPFTRIYKVLISFGYFFIYEYNIIAREYSLTVLLALLIAYNIRKVPGKLVLLSVLIGLMIQINYFSMAFAVGFFVLIWRNILRERKSGPLTLNLKKEVAVGSSVLIFSAIMAVVQIMHGFNDRVTKQLSGNHGFENQHISDTITRALSAFIPVPFFDAINVWNHYAIEYFPLELRLLLLIVILLFVVWLFRNQKEILFFFFFGFSVFVAFAYQSSYGYARHQGHIFILFIVSLWMFLDAESLHGKKRESQNDAAMKKITRYGLLSIFAVQVFTSCVFYYKEIKYPFSNINFLVNFIQRNQLTDYYMCGYVDYAISPISAYINKPVYFFQSKSDAWFIDWSKSKPELTMGEILDGTVAQLGKHDSLVVILTSSIKKAGRQLPEFKIHRQNINISFVLLGACNQECIVKDEEYYIYIVKKVAI